MLDVTSGEDGERETRGEILELELESAAHAAQAGAWHCCGAERVVTAVCV